MSTCTSRFNNHKKTSVVGAGCQAAPTREQVTMPRGYEDREDQLEELFRLARLGDRGAFAQWMGMIEIPLRRSLHRFARAVDVEAVVQETLLRMWLVAMDPQRALEGSYASLKYAFAVGRIVALEEMRRYRQDRFVELEVLDGLPEGRIDPDPPDPALARKIRECMERLPRRPHEALCARVHNGHLSDRQLAATLRMKANTFFQNIVRARRLLRECLARRGVRLEGILS
jgi:DNA-directed RNA polymerase specialized sigma24 family protein